MPWPRDDGRVAGDAFANSSSSLIQSKITGSLVFVLLPPLSRDEMFAAYVLAAVAAWSRGRFSVFHRDDLVCARRLHRAALLILFTVFGAAILGTLGLIAGIWAEKFDQLAAFQNFLIMPLTFLSGVFYSTHTLPPVAGNIAAQSVFLHDRRLPLRLLRRCRMCSPLVSLAIVAPASSWCWRWWRAPARVPAASCASRLKAFGRHCCRTPLKQVKQYIAAGPRLPASRSRRRRPAFLCDHRYRRALRASV